MKTIVFDLDGTLCDSKPGNYIDAIPKKDMIELVNKLYDQGHTIFILTARGMGSFFNDVDNARDAYYELTENWLVDNGVKYHRLFFGKPAADLYVDDKGIRPDEFKDSGL